MTSVPQLSMKYQILSRHVASLPTELDAWINWAAAGSTLEKNHSQIEALDHFMRTLCNLNENVLSTLTPTDDVDVFLVSALDLTENVIKSHTIWDFFRDRLELRFVPQFQQSLLMADLVSYDCYTRVIDRAKALQIVPEKGFREYPLTGLITEFSPATWPRGRRPPALQNDNLPIPVIDLPWDHLVNPWELLTIAHEVGHDIDEDLGKLTQALQIAVANQLETTKTPTKRITQWQRWTSEILADLFGVMLTGTAFVGTLSGLLTLPRDEVHHISSANKHPPHYLRIFINTMLLRHIGLDQSADALEVGWKALYGEPGEKFGGYLPDIEPVVLTILHTPLTALEDEDGQRHKLSELITFTSDDHSIIHKAAAKLIACVSLDKLPIRYVVSASQLAFEQIVTAGSGASLEMLAQHTRQAIVDLAPPRQLPAGLASHRARQHLEDLACKLLERPLDDFRIQ